MASENRDINGINTQREKDGITLGLHDSFFKISRYIHQGHSNCTGREMLNCETEEKTVIPEALWNTECTQVALHLLLGKERNWSTALASPGNQPAR